MFSKSHIEDTKLRIQEWGRSRMWWLTPVILSAWEAEIRRIVVEDQSKRIVYETLTPK
jgi:hypothetical protein